MIQSLILLIPKCENKKMYKIIKNNKTMRQNEKKYMKKSKIDNVCEKRCIQNKWNLRIKKYNPNDM